MRYSIIAPVYNEDESLSILLQELKAVRSFLWTIVAPK